MIFSKSRNRFLVILGCSLSHTHTHTHTQACLYEWSNCAFMHTGGEGCCVLMLLETWCFVLALHAHETQSLTYLGKYFSLHDQCLQISSNHRNKAGVLFELSFTARKGHNRSGLMYRMVTSISQRSVTIMWFNDFLEAVSSTWSPKFRVQFLQSSGFWKTTG